MRLETFAAALARLGVGAGDRLAVAVSGGPDSLALLALAGAQRPGLVMALTVDHGLRGESETEARAVETYACRHHVAHATLRWDPAEARNRQADARKARYKLMRNWCVVSNVRWLATAHHADDQAETLLMRLARGSGVGGLSGIRETRPLGDGVTLVRPLLAVRKADLAAVVRASGMQPVQDPTNHDWHHDRTAARAVLAAVPWLDAARLAQSARHLADAETALAWAAERAWQGRATQAAGALSVDAEGLPRGLRFRLLVRALAERSDAGIDGSDAAVALDALDAGDVRTLAGVRIDPGPPWRLTIEPPR